METTFHFVGGFLVKVLGSWLLTACILLTITFAVQNTLSAQTDTIIPNADCEDVRFLMQKNITPYDLYTAGGVLLPATTVASTLSQADFGDVWALPLQHEVDSNNRPKGANIALSFSYVVGEFRFAVFYGMRPLTAYQPVESRNYTIELENDEDGFYTVVVVRSQLTGSNSIGSYSLEAAYPSNGNLTLEALSDESNKRNVFQPVLVDGKVEIAFSTAVVETNPGAVTSLSANDRVQVFFGNNTVSVDPNITKLSLIGGNFALTSESPDLPSTFYVEGFNYENNYQWGKLPTFSDGETEILADWSSLQGVWMLDECVGFKLRDGRTFIAPTAPEGRYLMAGTTYQAREKCNNFVIQVQALAENNQPLRHRLCMNWEGIEENSEVSLVNSLVKINLTENRLLRLLSTNININRLTIGLSDPDLPDIQLLDSSIDIRLDWMRTSQFEYLKNAEGLEVIQMTFLDQPSRPFLSRSGVDIKTITAEMEFISLVYDGTNNLGEQRLLLPETSGYLEVVTPAGLPSYTPTALPNQPGYAPRALNNTGGECYPVNTLLHEANCPPNGHPNPANGNLWYQVTDHQADGFRIDLSLMRSYNSALSNVDGPFGLGWIVPFLLDYNVQFDPNRGSREITPENAIIYRVGLDVNWSPRGIVTYTTPSGSQHVFTQSGDNFITGELRALTMPGWILRHDALFGGWQLTQTDGFRLDFDAAGRLLQYGYPVHSRWVKVTYDYNTLYGAANTVPDRNSGVLPGVVTLSDSPSTRRIELYFDANHHVVTSILRDLTAISDMTSLDTSLRQVTQTLQQALDSSKSVSNDNFECNIEDNCYLTRYEYQNNLLTQVIYPIGEVALYQYNDPENRLTYHNDPRAPISKEINYTYGNNGLLTATLPTGQNWQTLTTSINETTKTVQATDEYQNVHSYTYSLADSELREAGETYTLVSEILPTAVAGENTLDSLPVNYTWDDGLLRSIPNRAIGSNIGRNTITFSYSEGILDGVSGGNPNFSATLEPTSHSLEFGDGTVLNITYGSNGLPTQFVDRQGAIYNLVWEPNIGLLDTLQRENDSVFWKYTYNAVGLVETRTEYYPDLNTPRYTVTYEWDGLGRLIYISDSQLGDYCLVHLPGKARCDTLASHPEQPQTIITDPLGSITEYTFDDGNRLVEEKMILPSQSNAIKNWVQYSYDELYRLTAQSRWLVDSPGLSTTEPVAYVTTYLYHAQPTLSTENETTSIGGYQIQETDPLGRTQTYTYDGIGRIREIRDFFGKVTRYDYVAAETSENGLLIHQRDYDANSNLVKTVNYTFDLQWQLTNVQQIVGEQIYGWTLKLNSDPNLIAPTSLSFQSINLNDMVWDTFDKGRATHVEANLQNNAETLSLTTGYDFLGRPLTSVQGSGEFSYSVPLRYCDGGLRILHIDPAGGEPAAGESACQNANILHSQIMDAHQRVVSVTDEFGTRTFSYVADPSHNQWVVTMTADSFSWELHYDPTGKITYWKDEVGTEKFYQYDSLGRLRRVNVTDQPEMSYEFQYNEANLLTLEHNDIGQGKIYGYNDYGQVISEQDLNTSDTITYGYDANGRMTSIISAAGDLTLYEYDPLWGHLTAVVDPSGNRHEFKWSNDTLTYTDPLNNATRYTFNPIGQLLRIQNFLESPIDVQTPERLYEFTYDSAGNLTNWAQSEGGDVVQTLSLVFDGTTFAVSEPTSQWSHSLGLTPSGQLQTVTAQGTLNFSYDALGRLASLATDQGDYQWTFSRRAMVPTLTLDVTTPSYNEHTDFAFDPLHRRLTDEGGVTYQYATRPESSDLYLEVKAPYETRQYIISPGNVQNNNQPPQIVMLKPGQKVTYSYNTRGLLSEISTEVCIGELEPPTTFEILPLAELNLESLDICAPLDLEIWQSRIQYIYDSSGRLSRVIDAEQNVETFDYDDAGNLISFQNVNSETFTYSYDVLNRVSNITGPTGIRLVFKYDQHNQVSRICQQVRGQFSECQDQSILETYQYDALGRLVSQSFSNNQELALITHIYNNGLLEAWGAVADQVILSYEDNALNILSGLDVGADNYTLSYGDWNTLSAINGAVPVNYVTEDGVLTSTTVHDMQLTYSYRPDGYAVAGVGSGLSYNLSPQGLLRSIGDAQNSFFYSQFEYSVPNSDALYVYIDSEAGGNDLYLNHLNRINNTDYSGVSIYYQTNADGQIQRQSFENVTLMQDNSPETTLDQDYLVLFGYDRGSRPLTMRVTVSTGEPLYTLTLAYNQSGQLSSESRQYQNGIQYNITYSYENTFNQLSKREVRLNSTTSSASAVPYLPVLGIVILAGSWRLHRNRRIVSLVVVGGLLISATLPHVDAQLNVETFTYRYDDRGNLQEISLNNEVCLTYEYDAANRLIEVTPASGTTRRYSYDAYHRLVAVDNSIFIAYQGNTPLVTQENGETVYYGQPAGAPALFQVGKEITNYLIYGSNGEIYGAVNQPILLFDPLGRLVSFTPSIIEDTDNGCISVLPLPADLELLSLKQPIFDGMIWDKATNLYFDHDRVYSPELGIYLQRDPLGPDITGNVYGYTGKRAEPPVQEWKAPMTTGLQFLTEATQEKTSLLLAASVEQRFLPIPLGYAQDKWAALIRHPLTQTRQQLTMLSQLPYWLVNGYNTPTAQVEIATGRLSMNPNMTPGNGTFPELLDFDTTGKFQFMGSSYSNFTYLKNLVQIAAPPMPQFTTYQKVEPAQADLARIWQVSIPQKPNTPDTVLKFFPAPLSMPQDTATTLDLIEAVMHLPTENSWVDRALSSALPTAPDIPSDYPQRWNGLFSQDVLGLADQFAQRWPLADEPKPSRYYWGVAIPTGQSFLTMSQ